MKTHLSVESEDSTQPQIGGSHEQDCSAADVASPTYPSQWYDKPDERVWCQAWGIWLPKECARKPPLTYTKPGESAVICNSPHKAADFVPSLKAEPPNNTVKS